jgi:hypothetical protein
MSEYLKYIERGVAAIAKQKRDIAVNVTCARSLGDTWTEIGAALGMSKQGARQQFGTVRERAQHVKGQTTIDDHDVA